jgi:hypothetical protein
MPLTQVAALQNNASRWAASMRPFSLAEEFETHFIDERNPIRGWRLNLTGFRFNTIYEARSY